MKGRASQSREEDLCILFRDSDTYVSARMNGISLSLSPILEKVDYIMYSTTTTYKRVVPGERSQITAEIFSAPKKRSSRWPHLSARPAPRVRRNGAPACHHEVCDWGEPTKREREGEILLVIAFILAILSFN